jgi:predicted YcjX-like family ATPase
LRAVPRREYAEKFVDFVAGMRLDGPAEDSLIRRGHSLYREAMLACREKLGLRYLQPGRFLAPGPQSDAPFLWFFPMLAVGSYGPGSAGALLEERFEAYKRDIRENFFDSHFKSFNRQIMLVDVLGALHGGRAAFEDTRHAVADLAHGLRDGWGFWSRQRRRSLARGIGQGARAAAGLARRVPNPFAVPTIGAAGKMLTAIVAPRPIERVAFVATKADHVPALARDNLEHLLRAMADPAARDWQATQTQVSFHVAASILSTEDGVAKLGGQTVQVVRGTVLGEATVRPFYVGAVPSQIPPASFWSDRYFEMPVFRPPPIDPSGAHGIPHLGIDDILVAVIGDLL